MTVLGPVSYLELGITDAHNHLWIAPVPGTQPGNPVLEQYDPIRKDLVEFRRQGGRTILDCQPGGCGRDGSQLAALSASSGVNIIACAGFHRKKYYPQDHWLFRAKAQKIEEYIYAELVEGLAETSDTSAPVRAGFIKIALEARWADCPLAAMEGAAEAAHHTQAVLEIHTERGALAERACTYFTDRGLSSTQLVLCHIDKRPDYGLHEALASYGILLEYDTFYRPKYDPESRLWPLIEHMVAAGFSNRIALATDMAQADLYRNISRGPGLASYPGAIRNKLMEKGIPEASRGQLLGENIAGRLAGVN